MATSYGVIFDAALSRFSDYDILRLQDAEKEYMLVTHLRSARSDFAPICEADLNNCDDIEEEFADDLDSASVEILALGVAYYWCSSKVLSSELFKNVLQTKDFTFFSPGTLLSSLRALRDDLRREYRARMVAYSYEHGGISDTKVQRE